MYYHTSVRGWQIACLKEEEWSLFRISASHWEILRMESLPQGWKSACPKCLLFLSLSTARSFFVLMYVEGDDAAGQPLPGTWEIWTLFFPRLKLGQLPTVSASPPSAQSGLCVQDFLSVILHLSYLRFDHLLADAIFHCVFACRTMMSPDSIIVEIIILSIFNTVQLSFAFFPFPHGRDRNVSTAFFLANPSTFYLPSKPNAQWAPYTVK